MNNLKKSLFFLKNSIPFILISSICVSIVYFLSTANTNILKSHHGFFHASYVYQVLNGIIPPTNSQIAFSPNNTYWIWHLFVALLSRIFNLDPLHVILMMNAASLSIIVTASYLILRNHLPYIKSIIGSLFVFFILTPFEWVFFLFISVVDSSRNLNDILMLIYGSNFDLRYSFYLDKFINQSSYPTALGILAILVYYQSNDIRQNILKHRFFQFILMLLSGLFSPIVLFSYNLFTISAFFQLFISQNNLVNIKSIYTYTIRWIKINYLFFAANFVCLLYVKNISNLLGGKTFIYLHFPLIINQIPRMGSPFYFAILLILISYFYKTPTTFIKILRTTLILSLLATLVIHMPDHDEYKLILSSAIIFNLIFHLMAASIKNRYFYIILSIVWITNLIGFGCWKINQVFPKINFLEFNGININLKQDSPDNQNLQDICQWIRQNTPKDIYIITSPPDRDQSVIPVISQRRIFITKPSIQTEKIEHYSDFFDFNQQVLSFVKKHGHSSIPKNHKIYQIIQKYNIDPDLIIILVSKKEPLSQSISSNHKFNTLLYENLEFEVHQLKVKLNFLKN